MKQNRRESALFALPLRCLPELSVGLSTIQACHKGTPQTLQTKALMQRTQSDVLVTFQRSFYLQSSGYSCPQRNPKMFLKIITSLRNSIGKAMELTCGAIANFSIEAKKYL